MPVNGYNIKSGAYRHGRIQPWHRVGQADMVSTEYRHDTNSVRQAGLAIDTHKNKMQTI